MAKFPPQIQATQAANVLAQPIMRCDFCGGNHANEFC